MSKDIVVDACSFKLFHDELVAGTNGVHFQAIQKILASEIIIIDTKGLIRHEWILTCSGEQNEFVSEWINNRIINNEIQERDLKRSSQIEANLKNFGVPRRDWKYIYLAESNKAYAIVTEDVDFYDPREKKSSADRIRKLKSNSLGPVCSYLKKKHGIFVFILENTTDHI